jgi:hexosaminidase
MIDVGRKYFPLSYLRSQIRRMAWMKLNLLHLHLTDWNGFRFQSTAYPTLASPQHYTVQQLRSLDQYAQEWGVTIEPEIDVPGHSSWLTRWDPRLALTCPSMSVSHWPGGSMGGWMLDVTSPRARTVVKTIIKEMASVFSGPYIHIGGDEIEYDANKNQCPEMVNWAKSHGYKYPGDDIVDFINDLDTAVRAAGKKAEIWHWWDFNNQQTSITPRKDIRVTVWLEDPKTKAAQGYQTIGSQDGYLYVSPGYGTVPGQYGYMPADQIYDTYPFTTGPNIQGYKVSRWSDRAENQPTSWFDFYSRRPVEVLAERTWGGPRSVTAARFYQRVDTIGDPPPAQLTAVPQWTYRLADVSSQETTTENAKATQAFDGNPLTAWSTQYSPVAPFGPQHLTIDLRRQYPVAGVVIEPRQDGKTISNLYDTQGRIKDYRVQVSTDGRRWTTVKSGTLPDDQTATTVTFASHGARYVRLVALSDWKAVFVYAVGELTVLRAPSAR